MRDNFYPMVLCLIIFTPLSILLIFWACAPATPVNIEPVTMESMIPAELMDVMKEQSRLETQHLQNEPAPKGPVRVGMSIRDVINIKGAPLMVFSTGYGPLRYGIYFDFYAVEFLYADASVIIRHTKVTKITRIP